jgi:hypothetical protein
MYRLFLFILLVSIGSPNITAAYEVTNRAALRIDERHTLYLISYAFGHEKYGFKLPSEANRGAKQDNVLGYELQTPEGLTVRDGLAVSHIYSNTPKSGTEIYYPYWHQHSFHLGSPPSKSKFHLTSEHPHRHLAPVQNRHTNKQAYAT